MSDAIRERFAQAHQDALAEWKSTPGSAWYEVLINHMVRAHEAEKSLLRPAETVKLSGKPNRGVKPDGFV